MYFDLLAIDHIWEYPIALWGGVEDFATVHALTFEVDLFVGECDAPSG